MSGKKRGSQVGLKKNREDTKLTNTSAMLAIIQMLQLEKPGSLWTYKEVWSAAGLKSSVALNSPWNVHVREAVDNHNAQIQQEILAPLLRDQEPESLSQTIYKLRRELEGMKNDRDLALSKIALYQADSEFYAKKYESSIKVIERLRNTT